jgi:hypothetical protein
MKVHYKVKELVEKTGEVFEKFVVEDTDDVLFRRDSIEFYVMESDGRAVYRNISFRYVCYISEVE